MLVYSTTLNFDVLPLVEINPVTRYCLSSVVAYQRIVPVLAIFAQNLALYNKNNRVLLSQALCVIGSLGNLMFNIHIRSRSRDQGIKIREGQISSGHLSHDSAFDRITLLSK